MEKYSKFCDWACCHIGITDKNGEVTPNGKYFLEMINNTPEKILKVFEKHIQELISIYDVKTGQSLSFNKDALCKELLDFTRKRYIKN